LPFLQARELAQADRLRLFFDADLTCDIGGSIEFLSRDTKIEKPFYVYNPLTGETTDGVEGDGVVMMGVDILPSELPREASMHFGNILVNYIPSLIDVSIFYISIFLIHFRLKF
jgi:alanine dehydrogenase